MSAPSGRLLRLCQKELRETLRDRRTIITLVLMPLLVYPILSMTLNRFLLGTDTAAGPVFHVGVASEVEGRWLAEVLQHPMSRPPRVIVEASGGPAARMEIIVAPQGKSPEAALADGDIDVAVEFLGTQRPEVHGGTDAGAQVETHSEVQAGPVGRMELVARRGNATSEAARRVLVERLTYFNHAQVVQALAAAGATPPPAIRIELRHIDGADRESLLATIIPLVLVLMTITGAVYPAIDLTAGERERGTMEALIASPIPRSAVLLAKYVAVVTVALLTALANLGAMFTTLWVGGLMPLLVGPEGSIPWMQFLQILGLLVLFSGFFSAVLLALTSFARSFKEAQAYLIPLMLLSLTPAVLSLMPGVNLTGSLAMVPLLNIVLLAREILAGTYSATTMMAAVLATAAYAAAALGVAARLFGSDAVLRGSEMSFGAAARRPLQRRERPTVGEAAMTLALLFPAYFLASNALARFAPEQIESRVLLNAVVLIAIFGGLPLIAVIYCRDSLRITYRITPPRLGAVVGALVMGMGLWTWAHELFLLAESAGLQGLDASKVSRVEAMIDELGGIPVWLILAALALTPAVIEELCFRGYLFSALAPKMSPAGVIGVTAVLFGLFHVLTGNVLLIERFLPTTMLGVALGWTAWRTGSVWPGIGLHLLHNALLLSAMRYRDELQQWGVGGEQQTHLPVWWLVAGSIAVVIGGALVWYSTGRKSPAAFPEP